MRGTSCELLLEGVLCENHWACTEEAEAERSESLLVRESGIWKVLCSGWGLRDGLCQAQHWPLCFLESMPERVCFRGVEAPTVHDKIQQASFAMWTLALYSAQMHGSNVQGLKMSPPRGHSDKAVAASHLPRLPRGGRRRRRSPCWACGWECQGDFSSRTRDTQYQGLMSQNAEIRSWRRPVPWLDGFSCAARPRHIMCIHADMLSMK